MKQIRIFISVLTIISVSLSNCKTGKKEQVDKNEPVIAQSFILKSDSIKKQILLPGELIPYEKVQIRSKVAGFIGRINVDIGSEVKQGDVLVIIDAPEIRSRSVEYLSKKSSSESKFLSSKDTYERLHKASGIAGAISENDLQIAKNKLLSDSAEYQVALYAYKSNKETENYLTIRAPFNGIITKRNADAGAYVGNPTDKPILEIENNSLLRLRVAVPEAFVGVKLLGNKIHFTTRSMPDKMFFAFLARKAGSIDELNRSEIWEFEVHNENKLLKPGMFADVKMMVSRDGKSLLVPFSAVLTTLERKVVIRISNGTIKWVDISQGINQSDKTEIFGDITEGDTLVLKTNEELKPGSKVIPKLE